MANIKLFIKRMLCRHDYEIESNCEMLMSRGFGLKNTMITKKRCSKCGKVITIMDIHEEEGR